MKSSTQQLEPGSTPGIFQPVFSGSSYGQPVHLPYGPSGGGGGVATTQQPPPARAPPAVVPLLPGQSPSSSMLKQSRYMSTGGSTSSSACMSMLTPGISIGSARPLRKGGGSRTALEESKQRSSFRRVGRGLSPDYNGGGGGGLDDDRSFSMSVGGSVKKRRSVRTSLDPTLPDLSLADPSSLTPLSRVGPAGAAALKTDHFEANFSLFNASASSLSGSGGGGSGSGLSVTDPVAAAASAAVVHQDTWNIFSTGHSTSGDVVDTPTIGAVVDLNFAHELSTDSLADSLLNTATVAAEQQHPGGVVVGPAPFTLPDILDSDLVVDPGGGGSGGSGGGLLGSSDVVVPNVWSEASLLAGGQLNGGCLTAASQQTDTSSTASSSPGNALTNQGGSGGGASQQSAAAAANAALSMRLAREEQVNRPELSEAMIEELNDVIEFKKDERYQKHIIPYHEKISFPIGEGGRELLRACLNVRGCKGRQLQGASVPVLLQLAHQWNLWDVALRIKIERQTGQLSSAHEAFVRFKATQSQMRKFVRKEYMVTERDQLGKIARIHYDENRKIKLGKDGREALRAKLRRLHDKHASRMDELLAQHGFKYSELRNATVQQLGRMAFVCNLWDQVISACRSQEEKRDGKGNRILGRSSSELKLPENLINEPIITDENGQMSNDDARRTMDAVSQLLQQNNYPQAIDSNSSADFFNSATFAQAFGNFSSSSYDSHDHTHMNTHHSHTHHHLLNNSHTHDSHTFVGVKEEPKDDDDDDGGGGGLDEDTHTNIPLEYYNDESSSSHTLDKQDLIISTATTTAGDPGHYLEAAAAAAGDDDTQQDLNNLSSLTRRTKNSTQSAYNNFDPSTGGFF